MSDSTDIIVNDQVSAIAAREESGALAPAPGGMDFQTILAAVERGNITTEAVKDLFSLYEREQDRRAKQAFHEAHAAFKRECPPVVKRSQGKITGRNSGTSFTYAYASLEDIEATVGPYLAKHGLSYRWGDVKVVGSMIQAECILSHIGGHSESTLSVPVPWESRAGCSEQQKMGVAATYAQRYALNAVLGLVTCDPDTDGRMPEPVAADPISEHEAANLQALADEVRADMPKFLAHFKIQRLQDLPKSQFRRAVQMMEAKRAKQEAGK